MEYLAEYRLEEKSVSVSTHAAISHRGNSNGSE